MPRGDDPRAIRAGSLQAVRLGPAGHLRIRADALEDWLRPAVDTEGN